MPYNPAFKAKVVKLHYDDPLVGHFGVNKTLELIRRIYYWGGLKDDVRNYIRECDVY